LENAETRRNLRTRPSLRIATAPNASAQARVCPSHWFVKRINQAHTALAAPSPPPFGQARRARRHMLLRTLLAKRLSTERVPERAFGGAAAAVGRSPCVRAGLGRRTCGRWQTIRVTRISRRRRLGDCSRVRAHGKSHFRHSDKQRGTSRSHNRPSTKPRHSCIASRNS
jgi:hypothetical protein